jgi:hypothetical protein
MWKDLESLYEWTPPTYPQLNDERLEIMLDRVQSFDHWMLGTAEPVERLAPHMRGRVLTQLHGKEIIVYADSAPARYMRPNMIAKPLNVPRIQAGDELTGDLSIHAVDAGQFTSLRLQYLDRRINPSIGRLFFFVTCLGGKVFGAFALRQDDRGVAFFDDKPAIYLMQDFTTGSGHPKLAKLNVMAVLSNEGRLLAQRTVSHRLHSVFTTAWSDHPVSMKYRGVMKLTQRDVLDNGRYRLVYGAAYTGHTLVETLAEWRRKHQNT